MLSTRPIRSTPRPDPRRPSAGGFFPLVLALALALALGCGACGGGLGGSKRAFRSGRYADAQRGLVALEPRAAGEPDYALYRGLAEHALGDRVAAARWLRAAREAERRAPGTLSEDDRTRLHLALVSLEAADVSLDPAE